MSKIRTFDLAIVTSTWGSYSMWLPEWAESLIGQTVRPKLAVIADFGVDDRSAMYAAVNMLSRAGIGVSLTHGQYSGMGHARNTAVAVTNTEWVMHLDTDDLLLPHAVEMCAELSDTADVICLGARRGRTVKTFPHASRQEVLKGSNCSFSCSPFRRSLWEQRPYQTRNDWVDSVLWVGFAHLGARFVPTDRPGFRYREHADSFSQKLSKKDRQEALSQWASSCKGWTLS